MLCIIYYNTKHTFVNLYAASILILIEDISNLFYIFCNRQCKHQKNPRFLPGQRIRSNADIHRIKHSVIKYNSL